MLPDTLLSASLRWTRHNRSRATALAAIVLTLFLAVIASTSISTAISQQQAQEANTRNQLTLVAQQATKKQLQAEQAQLQQERSIRKQQERNADAYELYMTALDFSTRMSKQLQSIKILDQAIELNPKFIEAYFLRGINYQRLNQLDTAIASFLLCHQARLSVTGKGHAHALSKIGDIWRDRTDGLANLDQALAYYQQAQDLDANNPYAQFSKSFVQLIQGNRALAVSLAHDNTKRFPEYWEGHYLLAYMLMGWDSKGKEKLIEPQYDAAVTYFSKALRLQPAMSRLYQNRGSLYLDWYQKERLPKHLQLALTDYQMTVTLNPNDPLGWRMLYKVQYGHSHDFKQALQSIDQLERLSPQAHNFHAMRAFCYEGLKDYQQAHSSIMRALNQAPNDASFLKFKNDMDIKLDATQDIP